MRECDRDSPAISAVDNEEVLKYQNHCAYQAWECEHVNIASQKVHVPKSLLRTCLCFHCAGIPIPGSCKPETNCPGRSLTGHSRARVGHSAAPDLQI